jgi:signal transduction histidine kinase
MHGTLHIDSDVGCGTRVEVRLPRVHRREIMMPIGAANA